MQAILGEYRAETVLYRKGFMSGLSQWADNHRFIAHAALCLAWFKGVVPMLYYFLRLEELTDMFPLGKFQRGKGSYS